MNLQIPPLLGLVAAITVCGAPGRAQGSGAIGGYTLGFVFDSRNSALRALVGIPGAATLGAQLDAGVAIRQAYVSPQQNYAVALTDSGAIVATFVSATDAPVTAPLGFDSSAASVVTLSPDGSSAAFYSANESLIRIVTGLPASPAIANSVPTSAIAGTIRLLAITNDATQLVAAVDAPDTDSVILIDPAGNPRTLTNSSHISALHFIGGTGNLLVADDAADTVSEVQDVAGSASLQPLAAATDGIAGPIGVDASLDGKLVVVANGRAQNIFVFDPNGSQRGTYSCPCAPAGLGRLNGNSVFLLSAISGTDPLWLFDGDSATPRVVFIPAVQSAPAGSTQ